LDSMGQVIQLFDVSGNVYSTRTYNVQGLLETENNPYGLVRQLHYDSDDVLTNYVDANGVMFSNTVDFIGRVLTKTYPAVTNGEGFGYSTAGLVAYTNRLGFTNGFGLDKAGRKTSETNANGEVVGYSYNGAGDLLSLKDGKSHNTYWSYDPYGRVLAKTNDSSSVVNTNSYDSNGRLRTRWTPANGGVTTTYGYDTAGNLTNIIYSRTGLTNVYTYDALNRLASMTDQVGTSSYTYTSNNQLASEDGPWSGDAVTYGYDVNTQRRNSMILQQPSGIPVTQNYYYDLAHRLYNIGSPIGSFTYLFKGGGNCVTNLSLPNGAAITNVYDSMARMTGTYLNNSSGSLLSSYEYGYNSGNQRVTVTRKDAGYAMNTNGAAVVTNSYDQAGQLKMSTATEASGATNRWHEQFGYSYDSAGNLNYRTNKALVETFQVNNLNELTTSTNTGTLTVSGFTTSKANSVTINGLPATPYADNTFAANGVVPTNSFTAIATDAFSHSDTNTVAVTLLTTNVFAYDLNGNMTSDGKKGYDFDDENQLIRITLTNVWKTEFSYDGRMRRRVANRFNWSGGVWVQINEIHYIYDGTVVIQERDASNNPRVTYTRGISSKRGRARIGSLLGRTDGNGPAYYQSDGNGNIVMMVDSNQGVVAKYLYDSFGNELGASGNLASINTYRFSSRDVDPQSELLCYTYRYYSPNIQRWVNADPIAENGGLNLYQFVGNSPANRVDLFGLYFAESWGGAGAIAGGGVAAAGSAVLDVGTGGINILATPAEIATGSALGGVIGYGLGTIADWLTGHRDVPIRPCPTRIESKGFPPGYMPGDRGAEEWGRRHGVNPDEARGQFHEIKQGDSMSGAADKYGVNPDTGDVIDPEGNSVGQLEE